MFSYLKGLRSVQPFHCPCEILPDRVDAEEVQKPTVSPLDIGGYRNLICEQDEKGAVPGDAPPSNQHNRRQVNSEETHQISPSEELTELLPSEGGLPNPYRTQSPVETPAVKTAKQFRLVPVKQRDRTASQTVYVTLDMFEQAQGCWSQGRPVRSYKKFWEVVSPARADMSWNWSRQRFPEQWVVVSSSY